MLRTTDLPAPRAGGWRIRCVGGVDRLCGEVGADDAGPFARLAWSCGASLWWGTIRPDPQGAPAGEIRHLVLPDPPEALTGGPGWIGALLPEVALRLDRRSGEITAEIERLHPWSDACVGRDRLIEAGPDGNLARRLSDGRQLPLPEAERLRPLSPPPAPPAPFAPDPADLPDPPQAVGPGLWRCRGALYLAAGSAPPIRLDVGMRSIPACLDATGGLAGPGGRVWSLEDRTAGARLSGLPAWIAGAWWEVTAAGFGPVGGPYLPHGLDLVGDRPAAVTCARSGEGETVHIQSLDGELQSWRLDGSLIGRRRHPWQPPPARRARDLPLPLAGRSGDLRWTPDGMLLERSKAVLPL